MRITSLAFALTLLGAVPTLASTPKVVASIKPIHSLVSAVMGGTGSPELLVSGGASPHTFTLKPSHAAAMTNADLVFWVGPDLEGFLTGPISNLTKDRASVSLVTAEGLTLLEAREGGIWGSHDHHEEHDDAEHGDEHGDDHAEEDTEEHAHIYDPHIWLDVDNARALVKTIEQRLSETYPDLAPVFSENALELNRELETLDGSLSTQLSPVSARPYIVFHDAYQYFENQYGLSPAGSVTANPEVGPGAKRIADLKRASSGVLCVFAEPQFEARILQILTEDEDIRLGYLDPLGSALPAGPDHYAGTLNALATSITDCLTQQNAAAQ